MTRVTVLGSGTSVGVPRIACDCDVCTSNDPKNKRLRCSILIEHEGFSMLVDTTPDLRTQALRSNIRRVDAVLFTHSHADHLHGLDDVRAYCFQRDDPIPCYGDVITLDRIRTIFDYAFDSPYASALPQIELHLIDGVVELFGLAVEPITVYHGKLPVLAFRIGPFAYVTDCNAIPPESMQRLSGLDILILDALRHRQHPTHFSVDEASEVARQLAPRQAYFTHIAHDLDHEATNATLPDSIELAYDGLVIDFDPA